MVTNSRILAWEISWTRWLLDETTAYFEKDFLTNKCIKINVGNGNPLQGSCLENPRDGGAWWASVYGVAQSRTRLKWLSSSSSTVYRDIVISVTREINKKICLNRSESSLWFLLLLLSLLENLNDLVYCVVSIAGQVSWPCVQGEKKWVGSSWAACPSTLSWYLLSVCLVSLFCFRICLGRNSEYVYKEEIISWETIFLGRFSSFFQWLLLAGTVPRSVYEERAPGEHHFRIKTFHQHKYAFSPGFWPQQPRCQSISRRNWILQVPSNALHLALVSENLLESRGSSLVSRLSDLK